MFFVGVFFYVPFLITCGSQKASKVVPNARLFSTVGSFCGVPIFSSILGAFWEGVDMQSVYACACFVRIGRCCLGSILGSQNGSFLVPSGSLWMTLGGLRNTSKKCTTK